MTTQTARRPTMRRMAKPPMIQKTYRVPVALYEAAMDRAEERQENLSDVIRRALQQYAAGYRCRLCGNDAPHQNDICGDCTRSLIGTTLKPAGDAEASTTS